MNKIYCFLRYSSVSPGHWTRMKSQNFFNNKVHIFERSSRMNSEFTSIFTGKRKMIIMNWKRKVIHVIRVGGPSGEYLLDNCPTTGPMSFDAPDAFLFKNFGCFEGKWMLLEMWMFKQFQVTAGAKCNKNWKNDDEKSYFSNIWCCSKHVGFLTAKQILKLYFYFSR